MTFHLNILKICTVSVALFFAAPAQAVPVTINFDGLSDGDVVGDSFVGDGVTFVDAIVSASSLTGVSDPNSIIHTDLLSLPIQSDPIQALFSSAVSSVSLTGLDVGISGFSFRAFDATTGGNLVDSTQIDGIGPGVDNFVTLTLTNALIRRVEFSLNLNDSDVATTNGDGIQFDNLVFDLAPVSSVPIPAALPLFGTGLAVMGFIGWRRKRKLTAAA